MMATNETIQDKELPKLFSAVIIETLLMNIRFINIYIAVIHGGFQIVRSKLVIKYC